MQFLTNRNDGCTIHSKCRDRGIYVLSPVLSMYFWSTIPWQCPNLCRLWTIPFKKSISFTVSISALTHLEHIDLHAKGISTDGFSAFADLKELKSLSISGHALSNRQVMAISEHVGKKLDFLSICVAGDCTIETLSGFYNLNKLVVQHASTSDRRLYFAPAEFGVLI
jgi:hypothetical protein